jgi:hypothetical protein
MPKEQKERGYSTERTRVALIKELLKLLLLSCYEETRQKIKHFRTRSL